MSGQLTNILTIDLEDWYQGIELDREMWDGCESRIVESVCKLLELLSETETEATFFILGYAAERYPRLVQEISSFGHEIGTHGYAHRFIYKTTPDEFSSDLKKSIDILGDLVGKKITIHRAPYFSITEKSLWALDILVENGIRCDSSIFPIRNYRYGIRHAPRHPYLIKTCNGTILELPISTVKILGRNISLTGGFYLRFFPYWLIHKAIERINAEGAPAIIYLHPWELDPDQPRINIPLRIRLTHYYNLSSSEMKLRQMLKDFKFTAARNLGEYILGSKHNSQQQLADGATKAC